MDFDFRRNKNLDILTFYIPGNPISKQSVSVGLARDKSGNPVLETSKKGIERPKIIKFTPKKKKGDSALLKWAFALQRPLNPFELWKGPIEVIKLHFIFPWTQEALKEKKRSGAEFIYKTSRPDLIDNLNKALFDAATGIIYLDDSQIVSVNDQKKYFGDPPGTILVIKKMKD